MEVAEHEAEEWELLDRVVNSPPVVHERVDDPGDPEPPPELLRVPTLGRGLCGSVEPLDGYPVVEALGSDRVSAHEFQHACQIRDDAKHESGRYSGDNAETHPGAVGSGRRVKTREKIPEEASAGMRASDRL